MVLLIAFIVLVAMFILPFLPGIVEIFRKRDADPLYIAMHLSRDPRYFAQSFKQLLHRALAGWPAGPQTGEVMLSKKEVVQTSASLKVDAAAKLENLLSIRGGLESAAGACFLKEVYVSGNAAIGPDNRLQVLASDGDVTVAAGTVVKRWLDAAGDLKIAADCRLGISATCGGRLQLAGACAFRRLYGMPIVTGDSPARALPKAGTTQAKRTAISAPLRSKERRIGPESILSRDIVFQKDAKIGRGSIVNGSIKCYGDLELEASVTVHGDIFADGDVTIGRDAVVGGHIFSQGAVTILQNSLVSRPGVIKSIIGKKSVRLAPDVVVYGYISTEGAGMGCSV